jgi:hypothetical protein
MKHLFDCFGNAPALERAIEAATPNLNKVKSLQERQTRLQEQLAKNERQRERTRRHEHAETITEEDAAKEYLRLKNSDAEIQEKLRRIESELQHTQTPDDRKKLASAIAKKFRGMIAAAKRAIKKGPLEDMSWEDKRALVQSIFSGTTPDGRRMGVYIEWTDKPQRTASHIAVRGDKLWRYSLLGNLINEEGMLPFTEEFLNEGEGLTKSANR